MIEPNGKGGIAHYTYNLCSALANQGMDVTLMTSGDYELSGLRMLCNVRKVFKGHSLDENICVRGIKYMMSTLHLIQTIREERPSLVHYQWVKIPIFDLFIMLLLKSLRIATVYTAHNILPHQERFYHKWIFKAVYKRFDKIIVHSNNDKKKILALCSMGREKVRVIFHGDYMFFAQKFPITQTKARTVLGIPQEAKVALFFGPIAKYKGLEYLLRAFEQVIKRFPSAMVVVAGRPSPDFSQYRHLMSGLGLTTHSMTDLRYVPLEDVSSYFAAADVVVTPYLATYQSGVVQMAYAFAVPVVATAVGGLPEVVEDGETGYLVPPRDERALCDAIMKMFSYPERSREMGRRGRKLAQTEFSWSRIAEETMQMYKESSYA